MVDDKNEYCPYHLRMVKDVADLEESMKGFKKWVYSEFGIYRKKIDRYNLLLVSNLIVLVLILLKEYVFRPGAVTIP
ncbi:hypothetical protein LCGC14_2772380 [marine sediment metagenome]|uniref:Uncharacterized protein n=1 Tax=marine sediment metagenome TaxID=412755 RepID=A0A0F8YVR5_9ZZZZ